MCGIVGRLLFDKDRTQSPDFLHKACRILQHRGPDGKGIWTDGPVGFGHQRLAIIDLDSGDQPMTDAKEEVWITFNGEIYNFSDLREELRGKGYQFRTASDTEVILNAYKEWGERCLEKLNGIFAFGLWDARQNKLLLARDHLGIKPLFYYMDNDHLLFASEIKAILADEGVTRKIDPESLSDYLSLGYILGPKTIIEGISKLPPGAYFVWRNGHSYVKEYWGLASTLEQAKESETDSSGYSQQLEEHLDRIVKLQLVSDVPVGAFLSGGIDSSTIVQRVVKLTGPSLKTFSIGFQEKSYSELTYAKQVADHFGTDHYEQIVKPELGVLTKLAGYFDEPLADTSAVPMYFLSKLAREHVKVSLSGDGGDENFGGYTTYLADKLAVVYNRVPDIIHKLLVLPVVNRLPTTMKKVSFEYKLKQFVKEGKNSPSRAHYGWRLLFSEEEKHSLLGDHSYENLDGYTPSSVFERYYNEVPSCSALTRFQYVDVKTWLVDDILVKVDRASMAHGLEARVPLLDRELVESALALPQSLKVRMLKTKFILKKAMTRHLPENIINRKKSGFNAPIALWLRNGSLGPLQDYLLDGRSKSLIPWNNQALEDLWLNHRQGKNDNGMKLWAILVLKAWEDQMFD